MPEENKSENSKTKLVRARWRNFHFSGKVIFCSVLFGLALLLIGGLLFVIDSGDREKSSSANDENVPDMKQVTPPIFYVGAVFMGLGGFTIVVGTIMCLIETNVLRRRNDDSRPLITPQQLDPETSLSLPRSTQPSGTKKKYDYRKKSPSPARSKTIPNKPSSSKSRRSPHASPHSTSKPKEISPNQKSSRSEENFLTPINSIVTKKPVTLQLSKNSETESTQSMKSFEDSIETSLYVSGDFKTPSSSYENSNVLRQDMITPQKTPNTLSKMNINEYSSETIFSSGEFVTPVASPSAFEDIGKFHAEYSIVGKHPDTPTPTTHEIKSSEQVEVHVESVQQSTVSTIKNVITNFEKPQINDKEFIGIVQDPLKDDSVLSNAKINDSVNVHSDEALMLTNSQKESESQNVVNNSTIDSELQKYNLVSVENVAIDDDSTAQNDNESKIETPVNNADTSVKNNLGQLPSENKIDSIPKVHCLPIAVEDDSRESILRESNSNFGTEREIMSKDISDEISTQSSLDRNSKESNRIDEELVQENDGKLAQDINVNESTLHIEASNEELNQEESAQKRAEKGSVEELKVEHAQI